MKTDLSSRKAALTAGIASLLMFVAAMLAEFMARQGLVVPDDALRTAENIRTHAGMFRLGLAGYFTVLICDVLVSWALYVFLKPVHRDLALLTAWFRLLYTALLGAAFFGLVRGYRLVIATFSKPDEALQHFQYFDDAWSVALLFFAVHLALLAYLLLRSGYVPKIWGILLMIAALGYSIDNACKLLLTDYDDYKFLLVFAAVPAFVGEAGFALWLLIRGGKPVQKVA